jgi:hypothetical protein
MNARERRTNSAKIEAIASRPSVAGSGTETNGKVPKYGRGAGGGGPPRVPGSSADITIAEEGAPRLSSVAIGPTDKFWSSSAGVGGTQTPELLQSKAHLPPT